MIASAPQNILLSESRHPHTFTQTIANEETIAESPRRLDRRCSQQWNEVIDQLLKWRGAAGRHAPSPDCLASAIDFSVDCSQAETSVPTGLTWSGDGGVAFHWNAVDEVQTVEIVASGVAEFTRFQSGHVTESFVMHRNPRTRKLELRG